MIDVKTLVFVALIAVGPAFAQTAPPAAKDVPAQASSKQDAHRAEDIARHRQMARAHEDAARCLEAGTAEKQCQEKLRDACKGIGIGQFCGMRHSH